MRYTMTLAYFPLFRIHCDFFATKTRDIAFLPNFPVSFKNFAWTDPLGIAVWNLVGLTKQELSYRKQIARKVSTQYVEGIYDNPVTFKSRLTVTQGHWKRNHWVDHTRLTIRRVIGRWIGLS